MADALGVDEAHDIAHLLHKESSSWFVKVLHQLKYVADISACSVLYDDIGEIALLLLYFVVQQGALLA